MHVCKAEGGILALAGLLLHLVALLLPLLLLLLYCMVLFLHLQGCINCSILPSGMGAR